MANPSVTYTLSNGTPADATQVNTNFTDLINSLTDSSKSLTVDAITAAGAVVLNGNVNLGNSTTDDLTINGSLASTINIKTTNLYSIGSSTLGLQSVYFGSSAGAFSTRVQGAAVTGNITFTLPLTDGATDGDVMATDGSGVLNFRSMGKQPWFTENLGLEAATTTTSNDSIKITSADGSDLSTTNPGYVTVPGTTAGTQTTFKVTADVTIRLTGAHWGLDGAGDFTRYPLVVYAINNAGTLKWGVSTVEGNYKILDTDDDATAANITTAKKVLVNTSLNADSPAVEIGWFKATFDDTGGSSENLWAVLTSVGDLNMGKCPPQQRRYLPDNTGLGTLGATSNVFWRRVGDTLHVQGFVKYGTLTASAPRIGLLGSHNLDTTKICATALTQSFGSYHNLVSGTQSVVTAGAQAHLVYDGSATDSVLASISSTSYAFNNLAANTLFANADAAVIKFEVPITEWA